MDSKTKQLYLADAPPNVVKLEIKPHFEALTDKQKRYAHHISRLDADMTSFVPAC